MTAAHPIALALAAALISGSASAAPQPRSKAPAAVAPTTALQLVRRLLGIPQRVAVGGSRASQDSAVCLISPVAGSPVPLPQPTLLAAGELNEVRLQRGDEVLWRQRASSTTPIIGPIPWPIAPMKPGETLRLRLRPRGASGADFAAITLTAASEQTLAQTTALLQSLGSDRQRWSQAIDQASSTNPALAMALLTSPQAPADFRAAAAQLTCKPSANR
jgi:hypothetical protein